MSIFLNVQLVTLGFGLEVHTYFGTSGSNFRFHAQRWNNSFDHRKDNK